ncbi:MAG: PQQ-binding-like beta-propeller repeat protein [Candidatus Bathyarchaeota archaeon]|nr:PQQ-binding-like beta-propeller repeat protein [Candidatus Bathyarchaeota archaeon]
MKISKSRKPTTMIATILTLAIAATLVALPTASAHYPAWEIPTYAYISASPSVVGVNQAVLVVMWLNEFPPTAVGGYGDRWDGFKVEITKPDGSMETLGPFTSDPVGSYYASYTPSQVGTYKFVFKFPGDKITGLPTPPAGARSMEFVNDTYLASESEPVYVAVQQDAIQPYQETPLPQGYWTRPIYGANRQWSQIAGNWLGGDAHPNRINNYSEGPESAHILWTRPYWAGGVMDGRFGDLGYYNSLSYEHFWRIQPIIINGILYYNVQTPPRYGWYAVDLYTGETKYFVNTTGPATTTEGILGNFDYSGGLPVGEIAFGQIYAYESPNQHGGFPYLWSTVGPGQTTTTYAQSTSVWMMFDAFTGNYICSIANTTQTERRGTRTITTGATGTGVYGLDGSILRYNIVNLGTTTPAYYLQVWNTSRAIWYEASWLSNEYWMWRPDFNKTYDGRNGFSLNASIPAVQGAIREVVEGKHIIGGTTGFNDERGVQQGNLWALSLKQGQEGTLLWNITFTPPKQWQISGSTATRGAVSLVAVNSENGVFYFKEGATRKYYVYSLDTGQMLWESKSEAQWNFYDLNSVIYRGKLLTYGYGGILMAYEVKTGKVLWNWTSGTVGFEGYYENTPLVLGCIANGKIYLYSSEHSPSEPLRRDAQIWCIDTENGQLLWKIQSWPNAMIIADGRIITLDLFDNMIYCFGKGPSATTVTASPKISVHGTSVLIEGTVTDDSPSGRHNGAGSLDFTLKGTPAIADEDQEEWMEYLFQQRPCPANAKGVEVTLDALDPNGNFVHIGTVTSDMSGMYSLMFTPEVPGKYTIIATFAGSKSYGPSYAETAIGVDEAPPASPPPEYPQPIDPTMTILAVGIAIILVVIIVGVLLLRKK